MDAVLLTEARRRCGPLILPAATGPASFPCPLDAARQIHSRSRLRIAFPTVRSALLNLRRCYHGAMLIERGVSVSTSAFPVNEADDTVNYIIFEDIEIGFEIPPGWLLATVQDLRGMIVEIEAQGTAMHMAYGDIPPCGVPVPGPWWPFLFPDGAQASNIRNQACQEWLEITPSFPGPNYTFQAQAEDQFYYEAATFFFPHALNPPPLPAQAPAAAAAQHRPLPPIPQADIELAAEEDEFEDAPPAYDEAAGADDNENEEDDDEEEEE